MSPHGKAGRRFRKGWRCPKCRSGGMPLTGAGRQASIGKHEARCDGEVERFRVPLDMKPREFTDVLRFGPSVLVEDGDAKQTLAQTFRRETSAAEDGA